MNAWGYLAVFDTACVGACAYLATHDCPWWAAAFLLLAATTTVRTSKP